MIKILPAMQGTRVWSLGREDPLENGMATHSSILAWRIHRQRSLVGYSPWGHKESDTTEATNIYSFSPATLGPSPGPVPVLVFEADGCMSFRWIASRGQFRRYVLLTFGLVNLLIDLKF